MDLIIPPTRRSSGSGGNDRHEARLGGTQRLTRSGRQGQGDGLVPTGRMIDAPNQRRAGLVAARGAAENAAEPWLRAKIASFALR